jgi:predicted nucleic acid-binding protein
VSPPEWQASIAGLRDAVAADLRPSAPNSPRRRLTLLHELAKAVRNARERQEIERDGLAVGDLVSDAHLAALTIEHDCEMNSTDSDFSRFPGLRWPNPLA